MPPSVFNLIAGITLLLFGHKLFWLFVGCIGFVAGFHFANMYMLHQSQWMILIVGLLAGGIGAMIAFFLQQIAIGISGFVAGGIIVVRLLEMMVGRIPVGPIIPILFVAGGIGGLILMIMFFDPALIVISSLVGSTLITQYLFLHPPLNIFVFMALVAGGILIQSKMF